MKKLGPYEVQGEIGRGAMGIVYRGFDPAIQRPVALKTLNRAAADEADWHNMQERLFREARTAGALSHPGIVTIYQVGQDETGLTYVAMEYVDGVSLAQGLRQVRPSVGTTLRLLRQAADALDYAHRQGIVHRDVKPANLLIQRDNGLLKVADFGIARVLSQVTTATSHTAGSPAYMSPEQIQSRPLDGRSDQYSLAVVACEMLTGEWPFNADSVTSLAFKSVYEAPQLDLLDAIPGGRAMRPALERALAKKPEDRFPTCAEFVGAMTEAMTPRPSPIPGQVSAVPVPPVAKISNAGPALAVVGVAAGVLLLVAGVRYVPAWLNAKPAAETPKVELAKQVAEIPPPKPEPAKLPAEKPKIETPRPIAAAPPKPKPEPAPVQIAELRALPELSLPKVVKVEPNMEQAAAPAPAPVPPPAPVKTTEPAPAKLEPPKPVVTTPIQVVEQFSPDYTDQARREGIEGVVTLEFEVAEAGVAENMRVVRSIDPGLDRKAMEALAKWRFRPATADGKPVRKRARASMEFKLERPVPSLRKR